MGRKGPVEARKIRPADFVAFSDPPTVECPISFVEGDIASDPAAKFKYLLEGFMEQRDGAKIETRISARRADGDVGKVILWNMELPMTAYMLYEEVIRLRKRLGELLRPNDGDLNEYVNRCDGP